MKGTPEPGDVLLGRYVLQEQIGKGGFGTVFRATQIGLDEDVAVKVVRAHVLDDPNLKARFEREIYVAKQLRHPNTIRVLDVAESEDGVPFYVMEFVDGRSLADVLDEDGPMSESRVRHIGLQILKGLAEAHAKGVVHRDLKPENVLLCDFFGEHDFVKILDFGIAKALAGPGGKITRTDVLMGTPNYMSPEQALGQNDLDGRSDLYSVGLILGELLLGDPVVSGNSFIRLLAVQAAPTPLDIDPALLHCSLGPVIAKATAKDPDDRYPAAREMIAALEAVESPNRILAAQTVNLPIDGLQGPASHDDVRSWASTVAAGPNRAGGAGAGDGRVTPRERPRRQETPLSSARPRRTGLLVSAFLIPLAAAGIFASGVFRGDGADSADPIDLRTVAERDAAVLDDERGGGAEAEPELAARAALASAEREAEAEQLGAPIGTGGTTFAGGGAGVGGGSGSSGLGAGPAARLSEEGSAAAAELASIQGEAAFRAATDRVSLAVPRNRVMRFQGTERAEVRIGETVLGEIPFEIEVPAVNATVELVASRSGYRDGVVQATLVTPVVEFDLRRRRDTSARRADDGQGANEEPAVRPADSGAAREQGPPAGLFGSAPIDENR